MDARGCFKIVDQRDMGAGQRLQRLPNEVEEVVADMPGVLECAVVGVPTKKTGRAVKLVIVKKARPQKPRSGMPQGQPHGLQSSPKVIEFRTELPKTPVGKILRRELRDKVTEGGTSCNETHVRKQRQGQRSFSTEGHLLTLWEGSCLATHAC